MPDGMNFGHVFKDFAIWSTVCGVPHIADAKSKWTRGFWIIVFLVMLGMFIYQLYLMATKFFSYPATVNTALLFDQQNFPTVTVCNFNPYKYSVINNADNTQFSLVNSMLNEYKTVVSGGTLSPDTYGIYNASLTGNYERDTRARDALVLLANQLSVTDLEPALYTYEDLILECTFNGKTCDKTSFTEYLDPVYGRCYAFNAATDLTYITYRAGLTFGLKLLQTDYTGQPLFLPTTQLAGARVAVNNKGELPEFTTNAINAGVGYQTAVGLTITQIIRENEPYDDCVERESPETDLYPNVTYTLETCFHGCQQRDTLAKCNCADPRYNTSGGATLCVTKADLDCLTILRGDQALNPPNLDPLTECKCHPPCEETDYTMTASLSMFPPQNYRVAVDSDPTTQAGNCGWNQTSNEATSPNFGDVTKCTEWYASNALLLQVYFNSLEYQQYTELPQYPFGSLINDLGGQAGLWLGLSIISCIEVVGLILMIAVYLITAGAIRIRPDEDEMENDERIMDIEEMRRELDLHDEQIAELERQYQELHGSGSNSDDEYDNKEPPPAIKPMES